MDIPMVGETLSNWLSRWTRPPLFARPFVAISWMGKNVTDTIWSNGWISSKSGRLFFSDLWPNFFRTAMVDMTSRPRELKKERYWSNGQTDIRTHTRIIIWMYSMKYSLLDLKMPIGLGAFFRSAILKSTGISLEHGGLYSYTEKLKD